MRIGIPRESRRGETLDAATAKTASQLAPLGYDVVVHQGAGDAADQMDPTCVGAGIAVGSAEELESISAELVAVDPMQDVSTDGYTNKMIADRHVGSQRKRSLMVTCRRDARLPRSQDVGPIAPASAAATGLTRTRYFVTGPFSRTPEWSSARNIQFVHAKEAGRLTTLCGLSTGSWTTLWEVPFCAQYLQSACQTCRLRAGDCCTSR